MILCALLALVDCLGIQLHGLSYWISFVQVLVVVSLTQQMHGMNVVLAFEVHCAARARP